MYLSSSSKFRNSHFRFTLMIIFLLVYNNIELTFFIDLSSMIPSFFLSNQHIVTLRFNFSKKKTKHLRDEPELKKLKSILKSNTLILTLFLFFFHICIFTNKIINSNGDKSRKKKHYKNGLFIAKIRLLQHHHHCKQAAAQLPTHTKRIINIASNTVPLPPPRIAPSHKIQHTRKMSLRCITESAY